MNAQSLGYAGAEAVGLNQGPYQGADVFDAGALGQIAERFYPRFPGASFEIEEMKFSAQFRVCGAQVVAYPHHGLIERQAGFHADHGQIEGVGKTEAKAELPLLELPFQQESRDKKAERSHAEQQRGRTK